MSNAPWRVVRNSQGQWCAWEKAQGGHGSRAFRTYREAINHSTRLARSQLPPYRPTTEYNKDDWEFYIRAEYWGEIDIIKYILARHNIINHPTALAMEIVGYYTGCLASNGEPRKPRR